MITTNTNSITKNRLLDDLFIVFPFWFPIFYIFLVFNFPSISKYLFILTLFLFAETHFASTWLFFFDKQNWSWLKRNFYNIFFIPLYSFSLIILIWFINPSIIIILHYLASGWHVTKQSVGILKLYKVSKNFYQYLIYFFSFSCLMVGLKNPGLLAGFGKNNLNLIVFTSLGTYFTLIFLSSEGKINKQIMDLMPLLTGIYIYLPLLFFENLSVATAIGVGMHWCQYLAIIWSTYLRKSKVNKKNVYSFNLYRNLFFVITYSFLMTFLALKGMPDFSNSNPSYSFIYLIPVLFQLYHFYIDGFIWKFSDKHISNSVKPYIFSKQLKK